MVVKEANKKKRLSWFLERRRWPLNHNWKGVIFSGESQIVIKQNKGVYVRRACRESYRLECMWPPHQQKVSVMVWECITLYGEGSLCIVDGDINAVKYCETFDNPVRPVLAPHVVNKPGVFKIIIFYKETIY